MYAARMNSPGESLQGAVHYPELALLTEVARPIGTQTSIEELEKHWLDLIFRLVPAERVVVMLTEGGLDRITAVFGEDRGIFREALAGIARDIIEQVLRDKAPRLCRRDSSAHLTAVNDAPFPGCAVAVIPLIVSHKMRGVIYVDSIESPDAIREDHLDLLMAVGTIAVAALDRTRYEQTKCDRGSTDLRLNGDWKGPGIRNGVAEVAHADGIDFEKLGLLGLSWPMQRVRKVVACAGRSNCSVLIHGESGTGKEVVARCIHASSSRASKPLIAINCAALTETLLESELFGHERGAFTGAVASKRGKVELADTGTLFLDEIGTMPLALQAKLLRVLEERHFERLGGLKQIHVDFRLLAATNSDLEKEVSNGAFRVDLYHRLKVIAVTIPPLRERREDIPLLAEHYARQCFARNGDEFRGIQAGALQAMEAYSWPGNVRELKNAIEHAVVIGEEAGLIRQEDLPESLLAALDEAAYGEEPGLLRATTNQARRDRIRSAFLEADCSYRRTAESLGVNPSYLSRLVRNLGLKADLQEMARPRGSI